MYTLTLVLPKDKKQLEKRYAELLAKAVVKTLNKEELDLYITEYKKQEGLT